jgi:ABC-2 type transport system ATP-binding protein
MPASSTILKVTNLKKYFYRRKTITRAVDDISFSIEKGKIIGLLGPNGAGKTTTIQMLLGNLAPTQGEIYYFGKKFTGKEEEIKKELNYTSGYSELPSRLTVWENLDVYARLYQIPQREKRIEQLLNTFKSWSLKDRKIYQLSAGQRTRVLLAKAFINWPKIILLDEPTASLDPEIASHIRQFLLYQQKEYQVTILLTSHNMKEVEEICDSIIFLNKGKILTSDTPTNLLAKFKNIRIKLVINKEKKKAREWLLKNHFIFSDKDNKVEIQTQEEQIPKILYQFSHSGVLYSSMEILRPTLEDFFLKIATGGKNES